MTYLEAYLKEHPEVSADAAIRECARHAVMAPWPDTCYLRGAGDEEIVCSACWNRVMPETNTETIAKPTQLQMEEFWTDGAQQENADESKDVTYSPPLCTKDEGPSILDSGERRQFESGAVRDIQAGKGRCDLMPLDVVAMYIEDDPNEADFVLWHINLFQQHGQEHYLFGAIHKFSEKRGWDPHTMLLETAKQFEDGAVKYGESNWQKGIPVKCYIDSAVRHYLKWLRGDNDEPHDRAFCWNLLCCIWTCKRKPELNEYWVEAVDDLVKRCDASIKVRAAYDDIQEAIGYLGEVLE